MSILNRNQQNFNQNNILDAPLLPPPPPPQIPPALHYHTRQNNLLNAVLNNSFNSDRKTNYSFNFNSPNGNNNLDFDNSFNNSSFNSSIQNNSIYNTTSNILNNTNCSNLNNANNNFHALLLSPNLQTLFDTKNKPPPPPYPGIQSNITDMNESSSNLNLNHHNNLSLMSNVFSIIRPCTPQAFKSYMEQHAENVLKHHKAREYRKYQLELEMDKADLPIHIREKMRKLLRLKETNYLRLRRAKMNKNMFETIKLLGIGAFGEVNLVRKKDDPKRLYAMKILHKYEIFMKKEKAAHVKAERDILAEADNEWVVKLYYSFQDELNLYFVMDYVPGGDLLCLLNKLQIFDENLARFYIGELTCAIESVHSMGFIHRDIKPDNILIDYNGHIKLTDFGLSTRFHWGHNTDYYLNSNNSSNILYKFLFRDY
jgi:hypothetical protein